MLVVDFLSLKLTVEENKWNISAVNKAPSRHWWGWKSLVAIIKCLYKTIYLQFLRVSSVEVKIHTCSYKNFQMN